jgi:hypothetical protein
MKRNIFDEKTRDEILSRIQKLTDGSRGRWGKLSVQQMVRHLTEGIRMAFDEIEIADQSNFFSRSVTKWLFLSNIKPPGRQTGIIKTFPEIDIVELKVKVGELDKEREAYSSVLQRLINTENLSIKHPLFGKMNRNDWGLLAYAHADYHLTQFKV